MRPVTQVIAGVADSLPVPIDQYLDPTNVSLTVLNAGNDATYTVEWTQDDIWNTPQNTWTWFQGPANLIAATGNQAGALEAPVAAVRCRVTVAGAAPVSFIVRQAGAAQ